MASLSTMNEHAYKCDTCNRSIKVPVNDQGIEIVDRCIITANCVGKMRRVTNQKDINNTPTFPPEVTGLTDWTTRNVLFTYRQTVQSATWNIPHDLENNPTVFVYVNQIVNGVQTLVEVEPETVEIIDLNNIQVTFTQPESGLVQCIALSSQNALTPSTLAISNVSANNVQLSNNGELTFATLDPSTYISITVMFNSPASPQPIIIQYLNVTTIPSTLSPWFGVNYVTINSRRYYIRTINLLTTPPAPVMFQSGLIATGATVYFPNSTIAGQLLILLANAPQTVADRVYDKYIDTTSVNVSSPQLYYNTGNVFSTAFIVKNLYPPIITG